MTVIIIGAAAAWVVFSTILVTMACMNSSQLSQMEEPIKRRPVRARSRARRVAPQIQSASIPSSAETT